MKGLVPGGDHGSFGILVAYRDSANFGELGFDGATGALKWRRVANGQEVDWQTLDTSTLGNDCRADVFHQLLLRHEAGRLEVRVDGVPVVGALVVPAASGCVALFTRGTQAAFAAISLTSLR
jgi:hypothetical protein